MTRTPQAVRQSNIDAENANNLCLNGCGHLVRRHLELDREDPRYQPLHFHCQEDGCGCVRIVAW